MQREQFEAWMKSLGSSDANLERWDREADQYGSQVAQAAWEGWQASRHATLEEAAILIDTYAFRQATLGRMIAAQECAEKIRALAASDSNGGKS